MTIGVALFLVGLTVWTVAAGMVIGDWIIRRNREAECRAHGHIYGCARCGNRLR